ncbi:unnamed protein product [Ectocarpus sp. CCAP 1310/34]|nr:unnamed protein product [Ectocarpus sp. CCAP 1310/34]
MLFKRSSARTLSSSVGRLRFSAPRTFLRAVLPTGFKLPSAPARFSFPVARPSGQGRFEDAAPAVESVLDSLRLLELTHPCVYLVVAKRVMHTAQSMKVASADTAWVVRQQWGAGCVVRRCQAVGTRGARHPWELCVSLAMMAYCCTAA